jgi:hypothetical protein
MADDVEQKLEAPKIQRPSDATAEAGVIAGTPNQEVHGQAFAVTHANDIRPSDPSLVAAKDGETLEEFKARVAQIQANSFGFFGELTPEDMGRKTGTAQAALQKPATEQVLLVSNITPNVPNLEQKQQYQDIQGNWATPKIAQNLEYNGGLPTLLPDFAIKAGIQIWDGSEDPFEGSEKKLMESTTAANPYAWEDAKAAFPQLSDVSTELMKSYELVGKIISKLVRRSY